MGDIYTYYIFGMKSTLINDIKNDKYFNIIRLKS